MIRIDCPFCGPRDHTEFAYGGDGSIEYPALEAPQADWLKAVYERSNICGPQIATWQHLTGCRVWLKVERDSLTHEILSVEPANPRMKELLGHD